LTRSKDEAENKKLFEQIIQTIGENVRFFFLTSFLAISLTLLCLQNKVGTLPKDKMAGKFVTEWQGVLSSSGADIKEVDVALGVSTLLAAKDSEELVRSPFSLPPFLAYASLPPQQNERNASAMTKKLMKHFSDAMSSYIDSNAKITHEKLGEEIENRLEDSKFWKKLNLGDGVRSSSSRSSRSSSHAFPPRSSRPALATGATRPSSSPAATTTSSLRLRRTTKGSSLVSSSVRSVSATSRTAVTLAVPS
jgi:hypothetical protein